MFRYIKILTVLLFLTATANAGIQDHLKRLEEKPAGHNMPNVD